jgi:phosphoribosylanthranilate isomerase
MEPIKLKVCGMRDPGNIRDVVALKPDFMGFIFYENTPRFVGVDFMIPEKIPQTTKRVGVFVNERTEAILEKVKAHRLHFVQLHGGESVEQCRELKAHGVGVIKVFAVDDDTDFGVTRDFAETVDYFLFDTKGKYYGGNARRFNWSILSRYDQRVPFFLSGGITPDDVDEIKRLQGFNLAAIDVNSGVEVSPACKDVNKIKAIKAKLNL